MITLRKALASWGSTTFQETLKAEMESLDWQMLPLQEGLSQGSYVSDSGFSVMVLGAAEETESVQAKVGIFYQGIIPGCNCADDPTPLNELTEYCEVYVQIQKKTAITTIRLSSE